MKEIILNMNEKNKYEIIKKLVETNGNKLYDRTKLNVTKRTINRLSHKYKERGKSLVQHANLGKKPTIATDPYLSNIIILENLFFLAYQERVKKHENVFNFSCLFLKKSGQNQKLLTGKNPVFSSFY